MRSTQAPRPLAVIAMGSAAIIMAYQVALKATRDTLFLSNFHVRSLPIMITAAAVLSIVAALLATRAIVRQGPARFVPAAFLVSALLTLAEWGLVMLQPGVGAIVVYLHVAAITPVLLSGFWSIVNEDFDLRTAKQSLGSIAAVGTLGGLAGGILAERLTAWSGVASTLPALALLQVACAWNTKRLPPADAPRARADAHAPLTVREAGRRLLQKPYLRNVALLILGSSVSATLLDYVFKAQAFGTAGRSLDLMRVFSAFYALVAVVTFVVQALVARVALERAGVARTIGTLPAAVAVGGTAAALLPGPWSASVARGFEATLRGSLFRAGIDVLYSAIPPVERRATKTLVDVGCDRLGDMLGSGIVALVLLGLPENANVALLGACVLLAVATLVLGARLERGYLESLEEGLRGRTIDPNELNTTEMTTRIAIERSSSGSGLYGLRDLASAITSARPAGPLDPLLVAQTIRQLADDELARDAERALRPVAVRHVGQLVDALLDPANEPALRRRVGRVLAWCPVPRAVDGLTYGLADERFEVRHACGRALADLLARGPDLHVDRERILDAVVREARHERAVWASQRVLDQMEDAGDEAFVDDFLRARAGLGLEHVFTLLALVLPREPVQLAFRGLLTDDRMLRGTALEYLEHVLPRNVRDVLWAHLEPERTPHRGTPAVAPDRAQVLDELLRSNASIEINLAALRQKHRDVGPSQGP